MTRSCHSDLLHYTLKFHRDTESMRSILAFALLSAMTTAILGCKPTSTPPATHTDNSDTKATAKPAIAAAQENSLENLNAVTWIQSSVEYKAVTQSLYAAAITELDKALADKQWDALVPEERDNAGKTAELKPAIIMDIDETVLDNSPYQARLVLNGKEYDELTWDQWVAEKKAKPVPGVVEFAKAATEKGITIFYLSNRAVHLQEATIANLKAEGLPIANDNVFLGLGTVVADCEQNGSEKNCRRRLVGREYRVLMQFGDQFGDFAEVVVNTVDGRNEMFDKHQAWFGQRWWMLPNPSYGSWEPAVFNNDWAQPRSERQKAKKASLRPEK